MLATHITDIDTLLSALNIADGWTQWDTWVGQVTTA